jgi:type IV secretion system protein VirD4
MPLRISLWLLLYLLIFTPLASLLFLLGSAMLPFFGFPEALYQWPVYAWNYTDYPGISEWLLASGIPAAILPLLAAATVRWERSRRRRGWTSRRNFPTTPRPPQPAQRALTDNHGHTQWRALEDARKLFPGPHPLWGGVTVGEAYRVDQDRNVAGVPFKPQDGKTWGRGGTAPLLIDPCTAGSGHSLIFAGSGAFKTVSAVSTALTWTGSSVILDPSTELGPMLETALQRQGKHVAHIGIEQADDSPIKPTGFNVLGWIDIRHPEAELHVRSVVSWIYDETASAVWLGKPEDPFFAPMGRSLVTCLLAHLVWSDPASVEISLATFAAAFAVTEAEMLSLLADIRATSKSAMARRIAATLMECQAEETFSGVYLNAVKGIEWLFSTAYADLVSVGYFDPASLLTEPTTVFLNISLRTLETTPAIARVLVGALLNTVYMADGQTNGKVLFLLDEAAQLGRLKTLETARDTGRKYGIVLHCLWQSIGQMTDIWGREGTRAWIDAAHWIGYAAIRAGGAGKDLSDQLGSHGVLAWSEGDNEGRQKPFGVSFGTTSRGSNVNVHEIRRSLITAAELQQDLRDDEIIIVPATGLPIRCGRALWFRRVAMIAEIANSRFSRGQGVENHGRPGLQGKGAAATSTRDRGGGFLAGAHHSRQRATRT